MKNRILKVIVLSAILSLFVFGCSSKNKEEAPKLKSFEVIHPEIQNVELRNNYPASVQGSVSSEVRAKISGYILSVLVDEGEYVKKGQVLFRLETATLNEDAKVAYAQLEVAKVEVERLTPLVKKNVISGVQLKTAEAKLAAQQSNLNSILSNIEYGQISSPVNGVVGSINFREGTLVGPNTTPLTVVSDIDIVYAYFSMNEKDFISFVKNIRGKTMEDKIKNLPPVALILADGSEYTHLGNIETISGNIDSQTGSLSFRARFKNPERLIRDGSSGRVVTTYLKKDVVVIPYQCTFDQQGELYVYKMSENDSIYTSKIEGGYHSGNILVVEQGLVIDDVILAEGIGLVRSGTIINPKKVSFSSIFASYDVKFK